MEREEVRICQNRVIWFFVSQWNCLERDWVFGSAGKILILNTGGGVPTFTRVGVEGRCKILFCQKFRKKCINWENFGRGGGALLGAPVLMGLWPHQHWYLKKYWSNSPVISRPQECIFLTTSDKKGEHLTQKESRARKFRAC